MQMISQEADSSCNRIELRVHMNNLEAASRYDRRRYQDKKKLMCFHEKKQRHSIAKQPS